MFSSRALPMTVFLLVLLLAFIFPFDANLPAQERTSTKIYVVHGAATLTDVPYYIAKEKGFYRLREILKEETPKL